MLKNRIDTILDLSEENQYTKSLMYYSFRCTYCGRQFYTYDINKQRASQTLYGTVKQHLIDTGEDSKEYEMDDGATEDSNQIYAEMTVSDHRPVGGFEATHHTGLRSTSNVIKKTESASTNARSSHASSESHTSSSHSLTIFLLLIAAVLVAFIAFMLISPGTLQQLLL
jgi:hypothetical protein